ncbi:uncharacterized protein LOC115881831 [Sitophilus oryzae]|uniref:Uncharacterized protein LOC115881831 n=1 Tax=Sitophilus oryzae TaxID=7048 RepID=A0A6J2XV08_SITOR|nr:uncharacterized protein LOC115881831 [Sitophilus oryzae]
MVLSEDLLNTLSDSSEPIAKRMRIADKAFKSYQVPILHKETKLIKWAFNNISTSDTDIWILLQTWLSSDQFRDLVQNDIYYDDIVEISDVFLHKLELSESKDPLLRKLIKDAALSLINHRIFKQFFKYNLKTYFKFLSKVAGNINCPLQFIEFIRSPTLFPKNFISEEKFGKYFLEYFLPACASYAVQFKEHIVLFEEISKVVQKCIFNENVKKVDSLFSQYIEGQDIEKGSLLHNILKHLMSVYSQNKSLLNVHFNLIIYSFCESYSDFNLIYKFALFLFNFLNFNLSSDFNINSTKFVALVSLSQSLELLLILLDVISKKSFTDIAICKISFTSFLRKVFKSLIVLKIPTLTVYEIFLRIITINPLVIEPLINEIVIFFMLANNEQNVEIYEKAVSSVFEIFSKLHRIENFIAKVIQAFKGSLINKHKYLDNIENVYLFNGKHDILVPKNTNVTVSSIFSKNILQSFTNCISGLASWQIINLVKTFIFHLNSSVTEYLNESYETDSLKLIFIEILGILICQLLQSVKMADHTIPQNVVIKFVNGLEELKNILKIFGNSLIKQEHNHITMRTFLNIAYVWAEIYMTLTYYSINNEVKMVTLMDNTYTACNLLYLHSYLDVLQWQLISQRISNFGEYPCKRLLQKLFIQKYRAMLLFEKDINEDIVLNIVKRIQNNLEDTWKDLLLDKFAVNVILPKMDVNALVFVAEHLIEDKALLELHHIQESITIANSVAYVIMTKISKLTKTKRKHDQESNKSLSAKLFSAISKDIFLKNNTESKLEVIQEIKEVLENGNTIEFDIAKKETKILSYLKILQLIPIIYSNVNNQKLVFLYLYALHNDLLSGTEELNTLCENIMIGMLQAYRFQITDLLDSNTLCINILEHFKRHNNIFSLVIDNLFKSAESIKSFEPTVLCLIKKLESQKYLSASFTVIQAANRIKKSRMDLATKEVVNDYKDKIFSKMVKLACKSDNLIEAYSACLKHYLSTEKDAKILEKLTEKLPTYINYSLENISNENKRGCVILFTAILHNKQKLNSVDDDIVLKVWNACKTVDVGDEYSHLINLIVTLIPNESFEIILKDLLELTEHNINDKNYKLLSRQLRIWESILTCNINPVKMKIWQEILEKLIQKLLNLLRSNKVDTECVKDIIHLEENIIYTQHCMLSPTLVDLFLINATILNTSENYNFEIIFTSSISLLEKLLKHRNAMIMDRLPPFLQQYRIILKVLCDKSNSDQSETSLDIKKASDCAHKLEKLTKNLVACKKDMSRIAVFLIADILERYEQINLYPNVKLHLNNCVYSLVSLTDHHAVSYLMRTLSNASTEMFKILYEHYKKYYMFTGKV